MATSPREQERNDMDQSIIRHPKVVVSEVLEKLKEQIRAIDPYGKNLVVHDILVLIDEAINNPFAPGKFWVAEIKRRAVSESTGFVPHQPVGCPHCKGQSPMCSLCGGCGCVSADTYLRYSIDPEFVLANPNPIPPNRQTEDLTRNEQPRILPLRP